jgi:hypothetical protein
VKGEAGRMAARSGGGAAMGHVRRAPRRAC